MKIIMRGNKQLRIPDDQLGAMEKLGYVEVDERTGKPVKTASAEMDLKKENAALKKENKQLAARIKELEDELTALAKA